jgi:acyl-ACP thioesterase
VNNAAYWTALEEELVAAEPRGPLDAEIEHRAAAAPGEAAVHTEGAMRWITDAGGAVVATLKAQEAGSA